MIELKIIVAIVALILFAFACIIVLGRKEVTDKISGTYADEIKDIRSRWHVTEREGFGYLEEYLDHELDEHEISIS